jgi:hypothetical protein
MIDIVTVVFEQEIPVLRAQAQSIALNCQRIGIRNIYVVLNDSETIASQIDPAWWGPLANSCVGNSTHSILHTVCGKWLGQSTGAQTAHSSHELQHLLNDLGCQNHICT